jgi:hypothetical protein
MSASSIYRAANDEQLIHRVTATAYQVVLEDDDKANTVLGQDLLNNPYATTTVLMFPVAVDTEDAYAYALLNGNGSPGYDESVITDDALKTSVTTHWPMARPPTPAVP